MKTFHALVRFDLEQKTGPDGSYTVPIAYVEIQTVLTRWETDKNKTWAHARRRISREAKARRNHYPRFAVASQEAKSRSDAVVRQKEAQTETVSTSRRDAQGRYFPESRL